MRVLAMVAETVRRLRRDLRFSIVATLILTLAVGAAVGVCTVAESTLWPGVLALPSPGQLAMVGWSAPKGLPDRFMPSGYVDTNQGASFSMDSIRAMASTPAIVSAAPFVPMGFGRNNAAVVVPGHDPTMATAVMVGGTYFATLGVQPAVGRLITTSDERERASTAVISAAFWQRLFGSNPAALGQVLRVNGRPYSIAGVAQASFTGLEPGFPTDVWIPIDSSAPLTAWSAPASQLADPASWSTMLVIRRRDGVTADQVRGELQRRFEASLAADGQRSDHPITLRLSAPGRDISALRDKTASHLVMLVVVAGLVVVVGVLNVTILWVQRVASRARDTAIRVALGASRRHLFQQAWFETGVLAAFSLPPGFLLGVFCARGLHTLEAAVLDAQGITMPAPAVTSLGIAVACVVALAFTTLAAVAGTSRAALAVVTGLDRTTRAPSSGAWSRWRQWLIVAGQAAFVVTLLAGAQSMVLTWRNLANVIPPERLEGLLTFSMRVPGGVITPRSAETFGNLLNDLGRQPGVTSASSATFALLEGRTGVSRMRRPDGGSIDVTMNIVGASFFRTLGAPILLGRDFDEQDGQSGTRVAILDELLARALFPDHDVIGKQVHLPMSRDMGTVIGVVRADTYSSLRVAPRPSIYMPLGQTAMLAGFPRVSFLMRTKGDADATIRAARSLIAQHLPGESMMDVATGPERLRRALAQERALALVSSAAAVAALLLGLAGIAAVSLFSVVEREREIGIRMALGATAPVVAIRIVLDALAPVAVGIAIGAPCAIILLHRMSGLLFGLLPANVTTLSFAAVSALSTTLMATALPVYRAIRVEPATILRSH